MPAHSTGPRDSLLFMSQLAARINESILIFTLSHPYTLSVIVFLNCGSTHMNRDRDAVERDGNSWKLGINRLLVILRWQNKAASADNPAF